MDDIEAFWQRAQQHADLAQVSSYTGVNPLAVLRPPAWGFGATPEQADELLGLVLAGDKTATASALWDLSLIHISEPTRQCCTSRMPSSA